ncbi:GNAT family N-acetyltransferase [Novosphingobium profundi]|uniref:GNAT family N-acetyltransferase n=1 Tax=Novosphingobium profundi TaxID=1774954 RepID=UPI001BD9A1B4|nr:GNAT family N-acetyltransferase [Novosphingobium profundi]MBT0668503.1 GNAT family N-acetyltransferase [Novosphingobium profundi]
MLSTPPASDSPIDLKGALRKDAALAETLLHLNNLHARELSWLDGPTLTRLIDEAFLAARIGHIDAAIIVLDQDAPYDSPNFRWFAERHTRFAYIDRVVVATRARGRGLARRLYAHACDAARIAGHDRLVCEINADPPNPASLAFHEALGFRRVGTARLSADKTVDYFEIRI